MSGDAAVKRREAAMLQARSSAAPRLSLVFPSRRTAGPQVRMVGAPRGLSAGGAACSADPQTIEMHDDEKIYVHFCRANDEMRENRFFSFFFLLLFFYYLLNCIVFRMNPHPISPPLTLDLEIIIYHCGKPPSPLADLVRG
jgi:hypothetical protein